MNLKKYIKHHSEIFPDVDLHCELAVVVNENKEYEKALKEYNHNLSKALAETNDEGANENISYYTERIISELIDKVVASIGVMRFDIYLGKILFNEAFMILSKEYFFNNEQLEKYLKATFKYLENRIWKKHKTLGYHHI